MSVWLFQIGDEQSHKYPDDDRITRGVCGHRLRNCCGECGRPLGVEDGTKEPHCRKCEEATDK